MVRDKNSGKSKGPKSPRPAGSLDPFYIPGRAGSSAWGSSQTQQFPLPQDAPRTQPENDMNDLGAGFDNLALGQSEARQSFSSGVSDPASEAGYYSAQAAPTSRQVYDDNATTGYQYSDPDPFAPPSDTADYSSNTGYQGYSASQSTAAFAPVDPYPMPPQQGGQQQQQMAGPSQPTAASNTEIVCSPPTPLITTKHGILLG
jgi:hypothetical protein